MILEVDKVLAKLAEDIAQLASSRRIAHPNLLAAEVACLPFVFFVAHRTMHHVPPRLHK